MATKERRQEIGRHQQQNASVATGGVPWSREERQTILQAPLSTPAQRVCANRTVRDGGLGLSKHARCLWLHDYSESDEGLLDEVDRLANIYATCQRLRLDTCFAHCLPKELLKFRVLHTLILAGTRWFYLHPSQIPACVQVLDLDRVGSFTQEDFLKLGPVPYEVITWPVEFHRANADESDSDDDA